MNNEYVYKPKKNIIGQRFGRLFVKELDQEESNKKHKGIYICDCDCGKKDVKILASSLLKSNFTKSCGCYRTEKTVARNKKHNRYEFIDDYVIGYTDTNDDSKGSYDSYGRNYFYLDLEDYEKIKNKYWKFNDKDYVISGTNRCKGETTDIRLHRVIFNLDTNSKIEIDHIHGRDSRNDNRKRNLRFSSHQENNQNKYLRSDNTSGVSGVSYSKSAKKWHTYINKDGKRIQLGYYDNFDDAVKIRKKYENILFGEFSYDNSQNMEKTV